MAQRTKILSLTRKDFEVKTFRSGGPGGQHQNKRDTGVRITHEASGAVGESRNGRSQYKNKCTAFERLAGSDKFKLWLRINASDITARVADDMHPRNLKVEVVQDGRWVAE